MLDPPSSRARPRTLPVRSAVLSVLLGAHPEVIPSARLVSAAKHLDLPEASVRVALTRAVAAGDLCRTDAGYGLGERLLTRQQHQAEAVASHPTPWDGGWETAIVVGTGRSVTDRAALRTLLSGHRLAELREGVWLRPANLTRAAAYTGHRDLTVCETRHPDATAVARALWDLDAWTATGRRLLDELASTTAAPERLAIAAELVRHLSTDPMLPTELLPHRLGR